MQRRQKAEGVKLFADRNKYGVYIGHSLAANIDLYSPEGRKFHLNGFWAIQDCKGRAKVDYFVVRTGTCALQISTAPAVLTKNAPDRLARALTHAAKVGLSLSIT